MPLARRMASPPRPHLGPASAWSPPCSQPTRSLSNGLGLWQLHFHGHCTPLCTLVNIKTDTSYGCSWVTVTPGAPSFSPGVSGEPTGFFHCTFCCSNFAHFRKLCASSLPVSVFIVHVAHSLCLWDCVLLWPSGGAVFVLHEVVGKCFTAIQRWGHCVPIQLRHRRSIRWSLTFPA